ncbi:hypothetical protein NFI96_024438 [Prochilodus magdalenae]|nr:hypothetical protein NFI96_024438 [Prochilodus magdalenae]
MCHYLPALPPALNETLERQSESIRLRGRFSAVSAARVPTYCRDPVLEFQLGPVFCVLNALVGGEFDLEMNFIIQDAESITCMVELLEHCDVTCQAEIWSMFTAILRKSVRNLQTSTEVGLIQQVLQKMSSVDDMIADLLVDMLGVLASYSITVKELKLLFSMLRGDNGVWPRHAIKLLSVLNQMPQRHGPDTFFNFPGRSAAAIALPPIAKWPYQSGFTFNTWFRMDPLNNINVDKDKPYLYCFRTSKGIGYSAHFVGNCLIVTSLKSKGKGFQHCVKYDFQPRKWYMISIVHIYNRWRNSEIRCYVNGQLVSYGDMAWHVNTNDSYDKCFLGSSETADANRVFCGQLGAVYVFSEALNPAQIFAIHQLGPGYKIISRIRADPHVVQMFQGLPCWEDDLQRAVMSSMSYPVSAAPSADGCTTQDYMHTDRYHDCPQHHVTVTKDCSGVVPDCHGVTQNGSGSSSVTSPALVLVETPNESVCGGTVVSTKMTGICGRVLILSLSDPNSEQKAGRFCRTAPGVGLREWREGMWWRVEEDAAAAAEWVVFQSSSMFGLLSSQAYGSVRSYGSTSSGYNPSLQGIPLGTVPGKASTTSGPPDQFSDSTFKFKSESDIHLAEHHKQVLYDGKLASSIAFTYNAKATDAQLCLESSPRENPSIFVHSPHALMLQDVKAIVTHSIHSAIHSIGGIQVLFPLFSQLDYRQPNDSPVETTVCATLLAFLVELLKSSVAMQEQMLGGKGFLVIGYLLEKSSRVHITRAVLEQFLSFAKYLDGLTHGAPLLKQLCDHVLFNAAIWIHTPAKEAEQQQQRREECTGGLGNTRSVRSPG